MADETQEPEDDFDQDHPSDAIDSQASKPVDSGEETAGAPEEAATEEGQSTGAAPAFSLRDYLSEAGANVGDLDDRQIAEQWLTQVQRQQQELQEMRTLAAWGRQFQQHYGPFQQYLAQQQGKPQEQQAQQEKLKALWNLAEYDPDWENHVKTDENGNLVPAGPHVAPDLPMKIAQAKKSQREHLLKLLKDPFGLMREGLSDWVKEQAQAVVQQHLGGYHQHSSMERFLESPQADWMFAKDEAGQRAGLNDFGYRFAALTNELQQSGVYDPEKQKELAIRMLANQIAPAATAPTPAEIKRDKDGRFLKQHAAARQPNRTSAGSPQGTRERVNESNFSEVALRRMREAGISRGDVLVTK
jgi:hypothetical protein